MKKIEITRTPLESLACVNDKCELYGQSDKNNLYIRKMTGKEKDIRYLRCRTCREEFSERKNTPLWRSKIPESRAISIAEHLSEGNGTKATARLTRSAECTVERLVRRLGEHGEAYHHAHIQGVETNVLQADERYGFAGNKKTAAWEAEVLDPESKLVIAYQVGKRNTAMIESLLTDAVHRVVDRHRIALFTDGLSSYATLFPQIFGRSYRPSRSQTVGRPPNIRYRIPRSAAHVQIVKHRQGKKLHSVEIVYRHGSKKRIDQALTQQGYTVPNTSAIERRNGTARLMSAAQHRRSLTYAKRIENKAALGWWGVTVYNWCRSHSSLRQALPQPMGKKSTNNNHQPWRPI